MKFYNLGHKTFETDFRSFNPIHIGGGGGGGAFHLQDSKLLRTPKQNKPQLSNLVTFSK